MIEFIMKFGDVEVGRSAAQMLIKLGYPVVYFIHDYISDGLKFVQFGTIEMVVPEKTIFQ
jgi:hypothetical protein